MGPGHGKTIISSYVVANHSMATDVKNAGASWVDKAVVVDQGLITSRNPGDLEVFSAKIIEEVAEGRHERRAVA